MYSESWAKLSCQPNNLLCTFFHFQKCVNTSFCKKERSYGIKKLMGRLWFCFWDLWLDFISSYHVSWGCKAGDFHWFSVENSSSYRSVLNQFHHLWVCFFQNFFSLYHLPFFAVSSLSLFLILEDCAFICIASERSICSYHPSLSEWYVSHLCWCTFFHKFQIVSA